MKKWIRIFLVCLILVGGTAVFTHLVLKQFNKALDNLSASSFAFTTAQPVHLSEKHKEQILVSTSTPETILTSATSTDLNFSFVFPKRNSEVYVGCTYQISFQSSTTTRSLETTLINADTTKTVEPTISGLVMEHEIGSNSQSVNWKVGVLSLGEYYLKASNINGVDLENYSGVFTISKMPKGISVEKKEKICRESNGSF